MCARRWLPPRACLCLSCSGRTSCRSTPSTSRNSRGSRPSWRRTPALPRKQSDAPGSLHPVHASPELTLLRRSGVTGATLIPLDVAFDSPHRFSCSAVWCCVVLWGPFVETPTCLVYGACCVARCIAVAPLALVFHCVKTVTSRYPDDAGHHLPVTRAKPRFVPPSQQLLVAKHQWSGDSATAANSAVSCKHQHNIGREMRGYFTGVQAEGCDSWAPHCEDAASAWLLTTMPNNARLEVRS